MRQIENEQSSYDPSEVKLTLARYSFREALTKGKNYADLLAIGASSTANSIMAASNPWATVVLTAAVLGLLYVNESRYLHQNEKSLNKYREALGLEQVEGSAYWLSYLGLGISLFFAVVCFALGIADNLTGKIPDWLLLSTVLATSVAPIARKINGGIIANEVRLAKEACQKRGLIIAFSKTQLIEQLARQVGDLQELGIQHRELQGTLAKKENEIQRLNEALEKKEEKAEKLSKRNDCEITDTHSDANKTTQHSSPKTFFYHDEYANSDKRSDDDDVDFSKSSSSLRNDELLG